MIDDFSSDLVQVNVVKGHGRAFAIFLPLYFYKEMEMPGDHRVKVKAWLNHMADRVTTQAQQDSMAAEKKSGTVSISPCVTWLALSSDIVKLFTGQFSAKFAADAYFQSGMANQHKSFSDYEKLEDFYYGYQENRGIHGLLCIAGEVFDEVRSEVNKIVDSHLFKGAIYSYKREFAFRGISKSFSGAVLGPLGYADGISQIRTKKEGGEESKQHLEVLLKDFVDADGNSSYGSFLVYRKLEVDRDYFNTLVKESAEKMNLSEMQMKALYMGRFQNGTSLMKSLMPTPYDYESSSGNKFDYSADDKGMRCPMRAHVRVMNPRIDSLPLNIQRRSMLYVDTPKTDFESRDVKQSRGMLFLSYQKSIVGQLEPILKRMVGDALFYRDQDGLGTTEMPNPFSGGEVNVRVKTGSNRLTKFRGGECLYVPSPNFLRNIL